MRFQETCFTIVEQGYNNPISNNLCSLYLILDQGPPMNSIIPTIEVGIIDKFDIILFMRATIYTFNKIY
jgi:hypothetical protein